VYTVCQSDIWNFVRNETKAPSHASRASHSVAETLPMRRVPLRALARLAVTRAGVQSRGVPALEVVVATQTAPRTAPRTTNDGCWFSKSRAFSATDAASTVPDDDRLTLTDACATRLKALSDEDGAAARTRLRLAVEGGGCSGFKYTFALERAGEASADADPSIGDDRVFRANNGAEVVIDEVSFGFVRGATIDYVEEMIKSSFEVVKNPQADASCGCGASFNAKAESLFGA
jgi:iron-sulfur cluster assembly accessory protein